MKDNVQDDFLSDLRINKISVTVFLVNGIKLQGLITQFDGNTLLLRRYGHTQLGYKHSVSTIMPNTVVEFDDE